MGLNSRLNKTIKHILYYNFVCTTPKNMGNMQTTLVNKIPSLANSYFHPHSLYCYIILFLVMWLPILVFGQPVRFWNVMSVFDLISLKIKLSKEYVKWHWLARHNLISHGGWHHFTLRTQTLTQLTSTGGLYDTRNEAAMPKRKKCISSGMVAKFLLQTTLLLNAIIIIIIIHNNNIYS